MLRLLPFLFYLLLITGILPVSFQALEAQVAAAGCYDATGLWLPIQGLTEPVGALLGDEHQIHQRSVERNNYKL